MNEPGGKGQPSGMMSERNQSDAPGVVYAEFSLTGVLRFLSHQEVLTLFARAILRARLPVAFSRGFNPHPKVSLPLPRSVGMSCSGDLVRMEWAEAVAGEVDVSGPLQQHLPEGITLHRVWRTRSRAFPQASAVEWEIDLAGLDRRGLEEKAARLRGAPTFPLLRRSVKGGGEVEIDVRRFVADLRVAEDVLWVRTVIGPDGSLRPGELLEALDLPVKAGLGRISRTEIEWKNKDSFDPAA